MREYAVRMLRLGLAVAVVGYGSALAAEDRSTLATKGRRVAQALCSRCHDISDDYRAAPPRISGAPPAFITIAAEPGLDAKRIRRFVQFPHGEMDNVILTRSESDAVVEYIVSLRR